MNEDDEHLRQVSDLFVAIAPRMHAAALARTADYQAAEDLVQDVFRDAWAARTWFMRLEDDRQRAWLFRALGNKIVSRLRRASVRREVPTERADLERISGCVDPTEQVVDRRLDSAAIDDCWEVIKEMPSQRRAVLTLWISGLATAAIAEQLQIGCTTVRDHRKAGIDKINAVLGDKYRVVDDHRDGYGDGRQS